MYDGARFPMEDRPREIWVVDCQKCSSFHYLDAADVDPRDYIQEDEFEMYVFVAEEGDQRTYRIPGTPSGGPVEDEDVIGDEHGDRELVPVGPGTIPGREFA